MDLGICKSLDEYIEKERPVVMSLDYDAGYRAFERGDELNSCDIKQLTPSDIVRRKDWFVGWMSASWAYAGRRNNEWSKEFESR